MTLKRRYASALLLTLLAACSDAPKGPSIDAIEIKQELLFEQDIWQVVESRADSAPYLERVVPSAELGQEKEDLPTLIMAPPCEITIALEPSKAPTFLRAHAGIDRVASENLHREEMARVRFDVLLDGVQVWTGDLEVVGGTGLGAGWLPVGEKGVGLALNDAREITLRTTIVEGPTNGPALKLGFGRLLVDEHFDLELDRATPETPNVVVVVMDTLRADRTSSGDYNVETTPFLAGLASRGVDWKAANSAASWTWPSTASIMTGLLPEEHGVTGTGSSYLSSELDTLAEMMQRSGMATAAFVGNPLIVATQNFDQGFQEFHGTRAGVFIDGKDLVPPAIKWIRAHKDNRFFLYLHMVDPHVPYEPARGAARAVGAKEVQGWNSKLISKWSSMMLRGSAFDEVGNQQYGSFIPRRYQNRMQSAYNEVVWTGDMWFGRVLKELRDQGLEENTIVIFTSDHGEELLDHGMLKHSISLFQELVHVPLVIAGPGIPKGVRVDTPISNRAVYSTLARLNGFDAGPEDLRKPEEAKSRPVYFSTIMGYWNGEKHLREYGVRSEGWVLHFAPDGGPYGATLQERLETESLDGKLRLFDLVNDPSELNDLAAQEPERARDMLRLIQARLALSKQNAVANTLASGEGTRDMLRAIGYLDSEAEE